MKPNKIYFQYQREDSTTFMSVIEPHEWTVDTQPYKYNGMFKMGYDGTWNNVTKTEYALDEKDWRHWSE